MECFRSKFRSGPFPRVGLNDQQIRERRVVSKKDMFVPKVWIENLWSNMYVYIPCCGNVVCFLVEATNAQYYASNCFVEKLQVNGCMDT